MKVKIIKSNNSSMKVGDVYEVHHGDYGDYLVSKYGTDEYLKYLKMTGVEYEVSHE